MSADKKDSSEYYVLSLYIAGMTPKSTRAIEKLREICEKNLKGHYKLEIIDIRENPELAQKENIVASPTLIKRLPSSVRNLIGDMTDKDRLYFGLELLPEKRIP